MVDATERTYRISAVEKAFAVLDLFSSPPHRFTLSEISARTLLSANQTFRLLQTLVAVGYVRQIEDSKTYCLGHRAFGLVPALFNGDDLILASREALDWVHAETGEIVSLVVLEGDQSTICLYVRDDSDSPIVPAGIGSASEHLHAGAVGKILLAYCDDTAVSRYLDRNEPLHIFTDRTPKTRDEVWRSIHEIRAQGIAVSDGEVAPGMYGIAAPIRNRTGAVVAGITLAAPVSRSAEDARARHRTMLTDAAKRISSNLGYRAVKALG